ncbi:MAG: membrane protein insertase YidC [Planctomycetota bacterium]
MERRVFLTLIFCTLFTLIYLKMTPKPEPSGQPVQAGETRPDELVGGAAGGSGQIPPAGAAGAPPAGAGNLVKTEVGEIAIEPFESDDLRIEFTNLGAAITQVQLKKYRNSVTGAGSEDGPDWVSVLPGEDRSFGPALTLRENPTPTSPAVYGLDQYHWEVVRDEVEPGGARVLEFRFETTDGYQFLKRFVCSPSEHFIRVAVGMNALGEQERESKKELLLRAAGGVADVQRGQWTLKPQGVSMLQDQHGEATVRHYTASELEGSPKTDTAEGKSSIAWGGVSNLYFAVLLAPDQPGTVNGVYLLAENEDRPEKIQAELMVPLVVARDGSLTEVSFRYFVGPKDPVLLEEQGLETFLPLIEVDYGSWSSFRWINKLLLFVMRFFHGLVGNWGVSIILLTLLVRMCIFPVTRTQQVSMQRYSMKMQALKPKLDALKEKYKDKSQKFAQEQMKLLKEHNAKPPLLGCLSTLITFPVFIGMFQILRTSIELRQAPFAGWIGDLSLPDAMFQIPGLGFAFNLLPILATAAFVGQMALAPKPADPQARQQQKIMFIMPIVFGVMFYNYAAGLSLYMLTSSLYGMFEYKFIRQKFFPNPVAPVVPAK